MNVSTKLRTSLSASSAIPPFLEKYDQKHTVTKNLLIIPHFKKVSTKFRASLSASSGIPLGIPPISP